MNNPGELDPYLPVEDDANAAVHGLGMLLGIAALFELLRITSSAAIWTRVGCAIYAASIILLYGASTMYHLTREVRWRRRLRILDHSLIYVLIAGSYTPWCLSLLWRAGWWCGPGLLIVVWVIALAGVWFKLLHTGRFKHLSTVLYVTMGWLCLIALGPMLSVMPAGCIGLLLAGGILYTGGTVFYVLDHRRWFHVTWHVFVLLGSVCQYIAVWTYVPRTSG